MPWHQIVTLKRIFGWLADGGIYIIQDIETSYWDGQPPLLYPSLYSYPIAEAGVGRRGNAVEKLKQVADVINRKFLGDPTFSYLEGVDHDIASVSFVTNAVVLTKTIETLWGNRSHVPPARWPWANPSGTGFGYRLCPANQLKKVECRKATMDPEQGSLKAAIRANSPPVAGTPSNLEQVWPGGWRNPAFMHALL